MADQHKTTPTPYRPAEELARHQVVNSLTTTSPQRVLTLEHLAKIEAVLADTLGHRSFPTFQGIEAWEWRALLDAARKGLS